MKISVKQHLGTPTKKHIDDLDHLVIMLPEDAGTENWPTFPYSDVLQRRADRAAIKPGEDPLVTDLPNARDTRISVSYARAGAFDMLTAARRLVTAHAGRRSPAVGIYAAGLKDAEATRAVDAVLAAWLAAAEPLPTFKSAKPTHKSLKAIHIHGLAKPFDYKRAYAEADGNNLARALTALPPNELTPARYRERVAALAEQEGWTLDFLDRKALEKRKCGAFLAVARSSADDDDGIAWLRYKPSSRSKKAPVALVGKGICFDTGGVNLKPAKHMLGMHEDMAGSAVALGTLMALSRLQFDRPVDCWLALAQNLIGPGAYKQNEVVTACNGVTIEVVHTDAEGRMVLADALALASREQPALILDYATLTGACIYALGTRYSGAFTNQPQLVPTLIQAGIESGERVWPFPMDADYDEELDSKVADVKQCTIGGEADHILAARFLSRFVAKDTPWVHIDLAAATHKGGLAHVATETTGFGVRYSLNLLLDQRSIWEAS